MPKNKQTWEHSNQNVVDVEWSNEQHKDALLNIGIPLESNNWIRPNTPVRWASDSSYKTPKKGIRLTYSFISKKSKFNYEDDRGVIKPFANFSKKQKNDISELFKIISSYSAIKFKKVKDKKSVGTIRIGFNTITDENGNWRPGIYAVADIPNQEPRGGDIWFNKSFINDNFSTGLVEGSAVTPASVMLHEILHSLGLEHPDNLKKPTPTFAQNREHTLMADEFSNPAECIFDGAQYGATSTPMPWDIAGLQHLYGANQKTNKGDTIHEYSNTVPFYQTIWDASGNDTISLINFNKGLKINLTGGELSTLSFDVEDKRWSNKMHGNLGIAFDCIIENAIGGSGPDVITGNQADNQLDGQAGDDILNGGLGIDGITGGLGQDTFQIQPGKGHAIIMDFTSGEDEILLKTPVSVIMNLTSAGLEILHGTDLMAVVNNISEPLQQEGLTLR